MKNEDRLEELRVQGFLDEDEVIEAFMLKLGCDREMAEDLFKKFSSEYQPVPVQ